MALLVLGLLVLPSAHGLAIRVGVKAGDWAHYDVNQHFDHNSTLVKDVAAHYSSYNNTRYVSLNVTSVEGTNVTLIEGIHHTDGTTILLTSIVNVSLDIDLNNPPLLIMQNHPTLTSLTNGDFFGVSRTINSLILNSQMGGNSSALRYSWDNDTGVLLSEQFVYTVDESDTNTGTFTYTLTMTSTNLWHYIPPKNPPVIPPPGTSGLQFEELYTVTGIVGSIAVGVVAFATNRRSKSKRRSKTNAYSRSPR